jgi:hypothetical protein
MLVDGVANEQCLYVLEQGMEPAVGQLHMAFLPSQVDTYFFVTGGANC